LFLNDLLFLIPGYVLLFFVHFAALPQYFVRFYARRSYERKAGEIETAWTHCTKRTYTNRSKGGNDASCKPPEATRRVDKHVKSNDNISNQATRRECIQNSFTCHPNRPSAKVPRPVTLIQPREFSTSSEPSGKDGKRIIPKPPPKSDVKPGAESKAPHSGGQPPLHKINPSEQTFSKPQPNSPSGGSGKQKNYTWQIIGGIVLLLVSAIAVSSLLGCLYDNDKL
jgi:hypothetical protein